MTILRDPAIMLLALPLLGVPLIYFGGRLASGSRSPFFRNAARWLGLAVLLMSWVPFLLVTRQVLTDGPYERMIGSIMLRVDELSLLLVALALTLGALAMLYTVPYVAEDAATEKHHALLVALTGAIIGLACAHDLFNLWVWFEAMTLSSYLLVAYYRDRPRALEASVKYLIQSATGSLLVLTGIALIFAQSGELALSAIRTTVTGTSTSLVAGALLTVGFGIKVAIVPMHTWLPDAHSEAPSGISAMLSGVVVEAGLVALLRALMALSGVIATWGTLLLMFGAVNMLFGNLLALRQTQVKRLLAYSSLSHVGYMLMGLGITFYSGEIAGAQGGLFHLITHGLMKGLAFLSAGALLYATIPAHQAEADATGLSVDDLAGAAHRYRVAALSLSLALLGLGGLPPLAGFMSKWQIFVAGFATHDPMVIALVLFAALNSVLSLVYYTPLINTLYRRQPSMAVQQGRAVPMTMAIPLICLSTAVVAVGLWPGLVTWLSASAGQAVALALSK